MGKPAARVGDNHLCPMIDGPKPHVGGPILPPGKPTVLIGGLPAAAMGNLCQCVSPLPDSIMQGSPTVLVGGLPIARLFDATAHGGSIAFGAGTVLIGEFAAIASTYVFPGQQHYNNCGVQSCEQLVHQVTGEFTNEENMLSRAIAGGYAADQSQNTTAGTTNALSRQALLREYGIESVIIQSPNEDDLADALKNNKGVIAAVDAGALWNDPNFKGDGHAIVITEGDFDSTGNLTHVYINDTGTGQQSRRVSINDTKKIFDDYSHPSTNVTNEPVWNQIRK